MRDDRPRPPHSSPPQGPCTLSVKALARWIRLNRTTVRSPLLGVMGVVAVATASAALGSCVFTPGSGITSMFGSGRDELLDLTQRMATAQERGEYQQALELAREEVAYTLRRYGDVHYLYGSALYNQGAILEMLGRYDEARASMVNALSALSPWRAQQPVHYARAEAALAVISCRLNDFQGADVAAREALAYTPAGSMEQGIALFAQGSVLRARGENEAALPLFLRASQIASASGTPFWAASYAASLASVEISVGRFDEADRALQGALQTYERLGIQNDTVGRAYLLRADLAQRRGRFEDAETAARRGLELIERGLGADHPLVGSALLGLATVELVLNLPERALPRIARAEAIARRGESVSPLDAAAAHYSMAWVRYQQRNYTAGLAEARAAVALVEPRLGMCPMVAAMRALVALSLMATGQAADAEREVRAALPSIASADRPLSQLLLARILQSRGSVEEARTLLAEASRHPSVRPGGSPSRQFDLAMARALLELGAGDSAASQPFIREAFELSESLLRSVVTVSTEARLESFMRHQDRFERAAYDLARLRTSDPTAVRMGLEVALLRKGRLLDEAALANRLALQSNNPGDRARVETLRSMHRSIAFLALGGGATGATDDRAVARLREQAEQLAQAFTDRRLSSGAGTLPEPGAVASAVARRLPPGTALVEIVSYYAPSPREFSEDARGELRYLGFVLRGDDSVAAVDLGAADPMDRSVSELLAVLSRPDSTPEAAAADLHRRVLAPLSPLLGAARQVIVSPDGQLNLVPFAALHDGVRYAADGSTFTYLTSGRDLLREPAARRDAGDVVLMGDPLFSDFARRPAASGTCALNFARPEPLPATRQEVAAIAAMLPGARVILGSEASDSAFLSVSHPSVLHAATHGFAMADPEPASGDRAVTLVSASLASAGGQASSCNPLLRSALLFARSAGGPTDADGIATALEVSGMDLWGTQLVVLSACDSGRGDVRVGQGVYGLRRSLFAAGAETIVTSLWAVDDEATRDLMVAFYRGLLCGRSRAAALEAAARQSRQRNPHPFFWAPFVSIGRDGPISVGEMDAAAPSCSATVGVPAEARPTEAAPPTAEDALPVGAVRGMETHHDAPRSASTRPPFIPLWRDLSGGSGAVTQAEPREDSAAGHGHGHGHRHGHHHRHH